MSRFMHNPTTNRAKFVTAAVLFLLMVSVVTAQDPDLRPPTGDPSAKPVPKTVPAPKDKVIVHETEDVAGLLKYLRTISKAHKEYHLQDKTDPVSFSIPLDSLNAATKAELQKGIKIEMAKDGLKLDKDADLKQVHLSLTNDRKKFDQAHCFFTCTVDGKAYPDPAAKGKVVKIPVGLDFDEASSDAFAKLLLSKLVSKTGIPLNPLRLTIDLTRHTVVDEPEPRIK